LPLELAAYSWSDRDEGYAKKVKKVLDTLGGGSLYYVQGCLGIGLAG